MLKPTNKVKTMDELLNVGTQKEHPVVWVERWGRTSPVAFLQNWQAHRLNRWIKMGQFYHVKEEDDA